MSRPVETSPVRRVLMQSVMWIILAATAGLAAFVDARKSRRVVTLGAPQMIQDVSLRLPKDWEPVVGSERMSHDASLEVREDSDDLSARVIDVSIDQPSLLDAFKARERPVRVINGVPFGDVPAPLMVYTLADQDPDVGATYFIQRLEISRPIGNYRVLTLRLSHAGVQPGGHENDTMVNEDVEVLKQVAATLKLSR